MIQDFFAQVTSEKAPLMHDGVDSINSLVDAAANANKTNDTDKGDAGNAGAKDAGDAGNTDNKDNKDAAVDDKSKVADADKDKDAADNKDKADEKDKVDPKAEFEKSLLEGTDFKTVDELKEHLKASKKTEETPEQVKKREAVHKANVAAYAVENELMKPEDIERLEAVRGMEDEALVFQKFSEDVKEEVIESLPEDYTDDDIIKAIRERFESEFPLESKSEKQKARAEAKLKKAADEIRSPLQSSFDTAKSRFNELSEMRQSYPVYRETVDKMVTAAIPSQFTFYSEKVGEEDVPVVIDITEEKKAALLQALSDRVTKKQETFELHKQGKTQDIQALIKEELEYLLYKNFKDEGLKKTAEIFTGKGLSKGSDTGAKNSFATNQGGKQATDKKSAGDARQEVLDSTRKKNN